MSLWNMTYTCSMHGWVLRAQVDACGPLNLSGIQALHPASQHSRELWALIALAEGLGASQPAAPLCPQERGALRYQVQHAAT